MQEQIAWLRAQLDADERLATACIEEVGGCRVGAPYKDGSGVADRDDFPSYPWGSQEHELAFMAGPGHPDHVLCQVRSQRALLDVAETLLRPVPTPAGYPTAARTIKLEVEKAEEENAQIILRLLALVYKGRDGYRAEWAA